MSFAISISFAYNFVIFVTVFVDFLLKSSANTTSIYCNTLEKIDGDLDIQSNNQFRELNLENLQTVGGHLHFQHNPELTDVNMNSLKSTDGWFTIKHNSNLTDINLKSLQSTGSWLAIRNNDKLRHVELPALSHVEGGLFFTENKKLKSVNASRVEGIGGGKYNNNLVVKNNPVLEEMDLSSLTRLAFVTATSTQKISDNPKLHTIWVSDDVPSQLLTWCGNNRGVCRRKGSVADINGIIIQST